MWSWYPGTRRCTHHPGGIVTGRGSFFVGEWMEGISEESGSEETSENKEVRKEAERRVCKALLEKGRLEEGKCDAVVCFPQGQQSGKKQKQEANSGTEGNKQLRTGSNTE